MSRSEEAAIKRERRKAHFFAEITPLIREISQDEPSVAQVYVSNIDLSPDGGTCYVLFSAFKEPGTEVFARALEVLKLYRPSLRKAFAQRVSVRYAPELVFQYDAAKEKERRINDLLDKVVEELHSDDTSDVQAVQETQDDKQS